MVKCSESTASCPPCRGHVLGCLMGGVRDEECIVEGGGLQKRGFGTYFWHLTTCCHRQGVKTQGRMRLPGTPPHIVCSGTVCFRAAGGWHTHTLPAMCSPCIVIIVPWSCGHIASLSPPFSKQVGNVTFALIGVNHNGLAKPS